MAKISEVLHLAADEFLFIAGTGTSPYSCIAVRDAARELGRAYGPVRAGLARMGVPTRSAIAFCEFAPGPERQAARYSWLKFAALIAEEQGQ